ncbi:hypothetical protein ACPPVO_35120 [Dactylosporangium sp. McL0621]|uniref:hypothetical protein n=1 Tax=Dactylosporangium sp. McL0621 TaxID=3415678 RepID=UPI003CE7D40A
MATHHKDRPDPSAGTPGTAEPPAPDVRRRDRDERVARLHAAFETRLQTLAEQPQQWVEFLDRVAVFGARYSLHNQILLDEQARQRGIVPRYFLAYGNRAGTSGWLRHGRRVRTGEHAFHVWAPIRRRPTDDEAARLTRNGLAVPRHADGQPRPRLTGFRLAPVFELSQTDGIPFEPPTVARRRRLLLAAGQAPEPLTGEDPTGVATDVIGLITAAGYRFQLEEAGSGSLGAATGRTRIDMRGGRPDRSVTVRRDLAGAQRVKTMLHELAHIRCGHLDDPVPGEPVVVVHEGRAETEAESVAHVVCAALGLDTSGYSDPYVCNWAGGDLALVRGCAQTVLRVTRSILADLDPLDGGDTADDGPPDAVDTPGGPADNPGRRP